jgi:hypothetical protein
MIVMANAMAKRSGLELRRIGSGKASFSLKARKRQRPTQRLIGWRCGKGKEHSLECASESSGARFEQDDVTRQVRKKVLHEKKARLRRKKALCSVGKA